MPEKLPIDDPILAALARLPTIARQARDKCGWDPIPGSQAFLEEQNASDDFRRRHLQHATALANTRLILAEDMLHSIAVLRLNGSSYAPYPVARTAVEAIAGAWWLLDPRITTDERISRFLAEMWKSLGEARELPSSPTARSDVMESLSTSAAEAISAGFSVREGNGIPMVVGQRVPGFQALLRQMFDGAPHAARPGGRYIYEILSAFSHTTPFAINYLITPYQQEDGSGEKLVRLGPNHGSLIRDCAGFPLVLYLEAVRRFTGLFGWKGAEWINHITGILQMLKSLYSDDPK